MSCCRNLLEHFWRRGRDSNPRDREAQRFSRPPHSTTLPPLRNEIVDGRVSDAKMCLIGPVPARKRLNLSAGVFILRSPQLSYCGHRSIVVDLIEQVSKAAQLRR